MADVQRDEESPTYRVGRGYDELRLDSHLRAAIGITVALLAGIAAINVWYFYTEQGGAVWAWLVG